MSNSSLIPEGENLRRAIHWIADQPCHDSKTVETASVKFDLTPLEEAFLLRHFKVDTDRQT
ncbi:MAG: hypothetical protein PVG89_07730 [Gammaproteobacteria bacterium]|jgi:hypothetical protein